MATRVTRELEYDAPADRVREMLLDPSFREQVADAQRVLRRTVHVDGTDVRIELVHASAGVPAFATKFVGDEITIVQEESWSGTSADVRIAIPGKPGEMSGTARLAENDGTTVESVDLTVKVNIPLVGGKIEKLIAGLLGKALSAEHRVGRDWLAQPR